MQADPVQLLPVALQLPSQSQLEAANAQLQSEIAERKRTEADLRQRKAVLRDHGSSESGLHGSHCCGNPSRESGESSTRTLLCGASCFQSLDGRPLTPTQTVSSP